MHPELLTVGEVAAIFRCHHETVRKMIATKQLAAIKFGNRWLIDAHQLPRPNVVGADELMHANT
jgi:excisionase family DNA binding protein